MPSPRESLPSFVVIIEVVVSIPNNRTRISIMAFMGEEDYI